MTRGKVIFVIGVSGCGKSTVGQALATTHGGVFLEGDDYHPPENVAAMAAGQPLTDELRWGWLQRLATAAAAEAGAGRLTLVACSGLKVSYRDLLRDIAGPCTFLFLDGDRDTIFRRMEKRKNHYMPVSLLDSQFATLERPGPGETDVTTLSILVPEAEVIRRADAIVFSSK